MTKYFLYFLFGGSVITFAALLAEWGYPFMGSVLLVLPNLSLVGFYFINKVAGSGAVMVTVKSSLLGTIFVWPAYMLSLLFLIPRYGVNKSLLIGFLVSIFLAALFAFFCRYTSFSSWFGLTS